MVAVIYKIVLKCAFRSNILIKYYFILFLSPIMFRQICEISGRYSHFFGFDSRFVFTCFHNFEKICRKPGLDGKLVRKMLSEICLGTVRFQLREVSL